jgi:hypothetical protein
LTSTFESPLRCCFRDRSLKEIHMDKLQQRTRAHGGWALAALAAAALAGCTGGGDGSSSTVATAPTAGCSSGDAAECGALMVALTDADGDFVSYSVDVQSITLKRPNGASVEMLPAATRVDFAQLTDLSDLVSVATLEPGDFVGGTIRLDFSNAEIYVESSGQMVQANVVDEDGQPLGVTDLEIQLSDRNHLVITRGRTAFLSLDFDLEGSNAVDLGESPPVVTVSPFIAADVAPVDQKNLRLRGQLVDVDTAASSYTVDLRPWQRKTGNHGRVTVHTTGDTSFEINGATSMGAAGLATLDALPAGTLTVAFGTLDTSSREFTAAAVNAGDSVSGERFDAVQGSVVARSGDQLTVKGAFAVGPGFDARFRRTVLVNVGAGTKVLKAGSGDELDSGAISVGQSVVAFGTLTLPASSADVASLDATAGRVRLLATQLRGTVNSLVPGQLDLKLKSIDRLGIEMFDFSGTGQTAAVDADPADYEVATGMLGLSSLGADEAVKVLGFVTPFGAAPPDFDGRTVVDRRDLRSTLSIGWTATGTTAPFSSMDATGGLVLDLSNPSIGNRHFLNAGMHLADLLTLPASPTIVPDTVHAVFGLWEPGHIELFTDFGEFVTALAEKLGGGSAAVSFTASGRYDEGSNVLTASRISVYFAATN